MLKYENIMQYIQKYNFPLDKLFLFLLFLSAERNCNEGIERKGRIIGAEGAVIFSRNVDRRAARWE